MGDSKSSRVAGKVKVLLKLTSGKTLSLSDVLLVPNICYKLISATLLGKVGVKIVIEYDKIILTENGVFVGKGYCNQGLFLLNVSVVVNGNTSTSFAYLVDSIDLWHDRLGHVNFNYIKKMKDVGMLTLSTCMKEKKCDVFVESNATKKDL